MYSDDEGKQVPQPFHPHHEEGISDRLMRLRRWAVTGLVAAAELELHAWQRESNCPPAAALMLTNLTTQRGETAIALDNLTTYESRHRTLDPQVLQALICLNWRLDHHDEASAWLRELQEHAGHLSTVQRWMQSMNENLATEQMSLVDHEAEQLAVELVEHMSVVPSLLAAMKIEPNATTITTLRSALNHALRDIHEQHDQVIAYEALADLALLARDPRDARRWAHRGRRLAPYHVRFALILAEVQDDAAIGPPAASVLSEALRVFPHYPDVRAALIRREFADGQIAAARRRLQVWLNDQPAHPLALKLEQELAA